MADVYTGASNIDDLRSAVSNGYTTFDKRRMFNLGETAAQLSPLASPFFTYLRRTRKENTNDYEFKFLEDRSAIKFTDRSFYLDGTHDVSSNVVGDTVTFTVDDNAGSPSSVDWLVKGMHFAIGASDASNYNPEPIMVRIESVPVDNGSDTSFTGRIIADPTSSIADHNSNDGLQCQVVGSAYPERSGSPDVWTEGMDDGYGYTQITKTALDMSWRALATELRGAPQGEWARSWKNKVTEHTVDLERMGLFGIKASSGSGNNKVTYSDGVVGMIFRDGTPVTTDSNSLSYTSGAPFHRQIALSAMDYDTFLGDIEVITDPARGGSTDKLVLASRPVITWFNGVGSGSFVDNSLGYQNSPFRENMDFENRTGKFGHQILTIKTTYGNLHLVEEPLFKGPYSHLMCAVDLKNIKYRPLVGNGYNFDTTVITDVQANDDSGKKDMLYTDAGLEIRLPETHALWSFDEAYS